MSPITEKILAATVKDFNIRSAGKMDEGETFDRNLEILSVRHKDNEYLGFILNDMLRKNRHLIINGITGKGYKPKILEIHPSLHCNCSCNF